MREICFVFRALHLPMSSPSVHRHESAFGLVLFCVSFRLTQKPVPLTSCDLVGFCVLRFFFRRNRRSKPTSDAADESGFGVAVSSGT